jgi:hypothetical protein
MDTRLKKWKLVKDLPFQKADETEWKIKEEKKTANTFLFEGIEYPLKLYHFYWDGTWGDPLTSGFFEEIKPKKWRAKTGKPYFSINSYACFEAVCDVEGFFLEDENLWETNNYFRTKEQAEEAANRIKKLLADYQEEISRE